MYERTSIVLLCENLFLWWSADRAIYEILNACELKRASINWDVLENVLNVYISIKLQILDLKKCNENAYGWICIKCGWKCVSYHLGILFLRSLYQFLLQNFDYFNVLYSFYLFINNMYVQLWANVKHVEHKIFFQMKYR